MALIVSCTLAPGTAWSRRSFILRLFVITLFVVFLFKINQAKAAEGQCKGAYLEAGKTCASYQWGTTYGASECPNVTFPSACNRTPMPTNCACCCQPASAPASGKINANMPNLIMPDLEIKIPTINFTPTDRIKCQGEGNNRVCEIPWLGEYIAGIYKYAIGIIGILAAIVLMVGGVIWITAGGNASRIGEAKAWIGASLSGLIIALTSYFILYQINPNLVIFRPLSLSMVQKIEQFIEQRTGGTAEKYQSQSCPAAAELTNGTEVYTTGYYTPAWGNDHKTLCMIAMNCSCPGGNYGRDLSSNCDDIFPNFNKNYRPCKAFASDTPYCNQTASGLSPQLGDGSASNPISVAAPDCLAFNTRLCINNKNYVVTDRGSAITGKRIDIWSGSDINAALKNSGTATMRLGACQ